MKITVKGMMCAHCEGRVNKAVGALKGVSSVAADHEKEIVEVVFDASETSLDMIKETIREQGYDVE